MKTTAKKNRLRFGDLSLRPFRKYYQKQNNILKGLVNQGDRVLEIGPGKGFFSIPIANTVGNSGKVYCLDTSKKVMKSLVKKARKAGVENQIEIRTSDNGSLNLDDLRNTLDFAMVFEVVHKLDDQVRFYTEVFQTLKPGGKILFASTTRQMKAHEFMVNLDSLEEIGFKVSSARNITGGYGVILEKKETKTEQLTSVDTDRQVA